MLSYAGTLPGPKPLLGDVSFVFKRQGLALLPRLEHSRVITAHWSLDLGPSTPALTSQVAGTTGIHHHTQLILILF